MLLPSDQIYLCGPMRGLPNFNFPAFFEAEKALRARCFENIFNPAREDTKYGLDGKRDLTPQELRDVITRDTEFITKKATALVVLPGYEKSQGCAREIGLATWIGLPVYSYPYLWSLHLKSGSLVNQAEKPKQHIEEIKQRPSVKWVRDQFSDEFVPKKETVPEAPAPKVPVSEPVTTMPDSAAERKRRPLYSGVLAYFPDALLAVSEVSVIGNDQHNPGQPLHWDKSKSTDYGDSLLRHLMQAGSRDTDGCRHSAKLAWRALALLQIEIESEHAS